MIGSGNCFKGAEQALPDMVVPTQRESHQHVHVQAMLMAQIGLGLECGYAMHTTVGCYYGENAATASNKLTGKFFPALLADARG